MSDLGNDDNSRVSRAGLDLGPANELHKATNRSVQGRADASVDTLSSDFAPKPLDLVFHQSFSSPLGEDDVIVTSNTSISFHTSLQLLARYSSFFEGLATLPTMDDTEDRPIFELPSATTDALHAALTLITPYRSIDWLVAESLSLEGGAFLRIIQELCELVEAYDFENLLAFLPLKLHHCPWLRFALAALADDEALATSISAQTIKLEIGMMPSATRIVLQALVPAHDHRLRLLHATRRHGWDQCKVQIRHHQDMENRHNDFAKNCRKRGGCASLRQYRGSWSKLRRRAAYVAIGAIRVGPKDMRGVDAMADAVTAELTCRTCAYRVQRAFQRAMEATLAGLPTCI